MLTKISNTCSILDLRLINSKLGNSSCQIVIMTGLRQIKEKSEFTIGQKIEFEDNKHFWFLIAGVGEKRCQRVPSKNGTCGTLGVKMGLLCRIHNIEIFICESLLLYHYQVLKYKILFVRMKVSLLEKIFEQ